MPTITGLQAQKKNHQRINVYLDGEYAFSLRRIIAAWLSLGQELSPEKIADLKAQDAQEEAVQKAVRYLEHRPHSVAEIRLKLQARSVPDHVIDAVIEIFLRNGLLDDKRFAQAWVENRNEFRPRGKRALAFELRQRGLDSETIENTLNDLDEEELAYQAGNKLARRLEGLEWAEFRQKLSGFLARRGFDYQTTSTVTRRIWSERKILDTEDKG